ncbi:hypothetical protein OpiT1DRAFT_00413 [Opitutaceae bacterium TAV1]|nr:hypothetical protein OPIT5_25665 [Opitutaceae bacterium TAV5]EIQ01838.1 hypothetical protein OpiT1DRAFT_00413 [Opitutaceae bacterium TAV1]
MDRETRSDVAANAIRRDFPDWLPPMVVKELRAGLRGRAFTAAMVLFHAGMCVGFMYALATGSAEAATTVFWLGMGGGLMLVLSGSGFQQELKTKNSELLLTGGMTPWEIVCGKWQASMAMAILIIVSLLPYLVIRYFFGGVDVVRDLMLLVCLVFGAGLLAAVTMWMSGLSRVARIVLVIAFFMFGQPLLVGVAIAFFSIGMAGTGNIGGWFWMVLACLDATLVTLIFLRLAMMWIGRQEPQRRPVVLAGLGIAFAMVLVTGFCGAYGVSAAQLVVFLISLVALGEFS